MRRYPFTLFIMLSLLSWQFTPTQAANYYFSSSRGNDQRSANEAQKPATPWKSIAKLNAVGDILQPGDTVFFFRGDVFYGGILLENSGTENDPIVLTAYGEGEPPQITGFTTVQSWVDRSNGVYESEVLPADRVVNMVTVNDVNQPMGRFPNPDDEHNGYLYFESQGYNSVIDQEMTSQVRWKGATIVIRTTRWTLERRYLYSHYGKLLRYNASTYYKPDDDSGYFIQNHVRTLDQFGEWYYNPSTHKLSVYFGDEGPSDSIQVQVATVDKLVEVNGNNIVLHGLKLVGANVSGVYSEKYGQKNLTVSNCEIRFSGVDGVYMTGRNNFSLLSSKVLDSNSSGVKLHRESADATITDNLIANSGIYPGMGGDGDAHYVGIFSAAGGLKAECNTIVNTGYTGLRFARSDNLIQHNVINNFCTVLDDGGGIYTYTGERNEVYHNRQILGNIILNGRGAPEGTDNLSHFAAHGIYLDDNATDLLVENNTVANCNGFGIYLHNIRDFDVRNNTVYNNEEQLVTRDDGYGSPVRDGNISGNILFSKNISQHTLYLESDVNDFGEMGTISGNYHVRPFSDELSVSIEYHNDRDHEVVFPISLEELNEKYGFESEARRSPVQLPFYSGPVGGSSDKILIGDFDVGVNNLNIWSPSNDQQKKWLNDHLLGEGVLEVLLGASPAYLGLSVGDLDREKRYLLKFKASASEVTSMQVYLREDGSPWKMISEQLPVKLTTERQEYEILFTAQETHPDAKIEFNLPDDYTQYYIDEVTFRAADVEVADADEYFLFEYNSEKAQRTITLPGNFVDARNNLYAGEITLGPYESAVLIKKDEAPSDSIGEPSEDEDLYAPQGAAVTAPRHVVKVYPNPASRVNGGLKLDYFAKADGKVTMFVLDQNGARIQQLTFNMRKGWNAGNVNISGLAPGLYYLNIPNTLPARKNTYPFVVMQ